MKYKTIDLCAGIGGIRRGFELTNEFCNVATCEIDKQACQTYRHLFPNDEYSIENNIQDEEFKRSIEMLKYDVLLAGFPCQAFSSVGLKQGFLDKLRGTIFFDIADIIRRTQPKAIFLENVQNLFSHGKGNTLRTIIRTIEAELNYKVIGVTNTSDNVYQYSLKSFLRNSKNFGVPQNRPRIYVMAFSRQYFGCAVNFLPNALPDARKEPPIFKDFSEIMEKHVDVHYYMSSKYWETLIRHKIVQKAKGNGFGYCVINDKQHPQIANTLLATGGSGKERNLLRQPRQGVINEVVQGKLSPTNKEGIRVMTPLEWAKLQGFAGYAFMNAKTGKDEFGFPVGLADTCKYKQLGNAVTIPVIETMAKFMLRCFKQMGFDASED